jgi:hypothetical protein
MQFELRPHQLVGPIHFGMRREEVRGVIPAAVRAFKKTPAATTLVDAFDDEGLHVYYDEEDECEAVELAAPAVPVLEGRILIGQSFAKLRDWLLANDPKTEVDATGLTAPSLGVGLYAPFAREEPDEPVEGVIAFRPGYYR